MARGPTLSSHAFRRTRYPKGPRIFLTAPAVVSYACPPAWGKCVALTRRKLRNQFRDKLNHLSEILHEWFSDPYSTMRKTALRSPWQETAAYRRGVWQPGHVRSYTGPLIPCYNAASCTLATKEMYDA
jgi:hypothetical protein